MLRKGATKRFEVPDEYVEAVIREIALIARQYHVTEVDSIYVGGGTPSLLSPSQTVRIFEAIRSHVRAEHAEITFEGEAQSFLRPGLLSVLQELGVNRISFGVQTFHANIRTLLGRTDSVAHLWQLRNYLTAFSFADINIDLMYGLPAQSPLDLEYDLRELSRFEATSIDCHPLKYASCSYHLLETIAEQNLRVPTASERSAMFSMIRTWMIAHGYEEQFVDQYCKPQVDSANLYMRRLYGLNGGAYIGVGAGARSHLPKVGYRNVQHVNSYIGSIRKGDLPVESGVEAPLTDNFVTCFPKRNDQLSQGSLEMTSCPKYFSDTLQKLASEGFVRIESGSWQICESALPSYQALQEVLLSPNQRANHKTTAQERSKRFDRFNHHFDALGEVLDFEAC
jgi:oxygen-independent coproporphyrinogen-3 oxidase